MKRMIMVRYATDRNGFEETVVMQYQKEGIEWKRTGADNDKAMAQMPLYAWIAINEKAIHDWDTQQVQTLAKHYKRISDNLAKKEPKLLNYHGQHGYDEGMRLAKMSVPSKMLKEIRPLLKKSLEECTTPRNLTRHE